MEELNSAKDSNIKIGTAGWLYPDWDGFIYPRGFSGDKLSFVLEFVDVIEINTSFYRSFDAHTAQNWLERCSNKENFIFTVKLWQRFTHERGAIEPLEARSFLDGIAPIMEARKLGAILMQFPWSFRMSDENLLHLERLRETFWSLPLAVEVRHAGWNNEKFLKFLRERKMAFVNIDQPKVGDSLRQTAHVTAPFGYVRMHGRNERDWFREDADRDDRYDYLYDESELKSWLSPIKEMAQKVDIFFVIMNNHYRGQALVNAIELRYNLFGKKVLVPETLFVPYPKLSKIALNPPAQFELFT